MTRIIDCSAKNASGIEGVSFEIWEYRGGGQRRFDRRKTVSEVLFDLNNSLRRYPKVKNSMLGCRLSLGDASGIPSLRIPCSAVVCHLEMLVGEDLSKALESINMKMKDDVLKKRKVIK